MVFYKASSTPADISRADEKILMAMYGTGRMSTHSINELRYHLLPPTLDTAEHSTGSVVDGKHTRLT